MKKYISVFLISLFFGLSVVIAEPYYVNDNNVSFTKDEYDFITKMYYDGYQAYMTDSDKALFNDVEMKPENVESVSYEPKDSFESGKVTVRGTVHETAAKRLQIAKAGGGNPVISITCAWKKSPNVRSYDLIGAYLNGTTKSSGVVSKITYSGGTINPSATKNPNNGHGAVIKLPNGGNSIVASSTFSVFTGGRVYGSYQHAASSVSLNNANSYSIGNNGLGNVFYFSNATIRAKYDGMGGVFIDV